MYLQFCGILFSITCLYLPFCCIDFTDGLFSILVTLITWFYFWVSCHFIVFCFVLFSWLCKIRGSLTVSQTYLWVQKSPYYETNAEHLRGVRVTHGNIISCVFIKQSGSLQLSMLHVYRCFHCQGRRKGTQITDPCCPLFDNPLKGYQAFQTDPKGWSKNCCSLLVTKKELPHDRS